MTSSSTASTPWLVALRLQSNWGGSSDEDATSIQEDDVHYLGRFQFGTGWTSTSTPTTTVGVNLASAEDQVRDMVNRNLAQCGQAYIVDVLRRLQDRQRSLHHCLRLKLVAMEEVTTWFSTSVHSQPRIAAMFETASGTRLPDGSRKGILYASSSVCGCTDEEPDENEDNREAGAVVRLRSRSRLYIEKNVMAVYMKMLVLLFYRDLRLPPLRVYRLGGALALDVCEDARDDLVSGFTEEAHGVNVVSAGERKLCETAVREKGPCALNKIQRTRLPNGSHTEDYEYVSLAIASRVEQGQATLLSSACEWLQNNTELWKAWVPDVTSCFPGHGLFGDGTFVSYWQSSYGAVTCSPCSPGKFANDTGSTLYATFCKQQASAVPPSRANASANLVLFGEPPAVCFVPRGSGAREATSHFVKKKAFGWRSARRAVSRCTGAGTTDTVQKALQETVRANASVELVLRAALGIGQVMMRAADRQTLSTVYVLVVAAVVLSVSVAPFAVFCSCSSFTTRRTFVSLAIAAAMGGQTAIALQSLQAISQLNIQWVQPVKEFLRVLAMALNGFQTGVTCFVEGTSFATWSFALQLLAFPVFVALTSLPAVAVKIGRGINLFTGLFNIYGLILVALLTAISIAVVMPLKCRKNPNLTYTLEAHPQVICWNSQEHETLVLLSVIGVLVYPATVLSMLLWATYKYPRWLRSDRGVETLHRFHFLFGRSSPYASFSGSSKWFIVCGGLGKLKQPTGVNLYCLVAPYTIFLSHHKVSSSMLCRYIKVVVAKLAPAFHVFNDADNLHNLEMLFGTLKNDVDVFLAVLSANVFSSFWCIAEMTTAFANKVPMLVLRCDDPPHIGDNFMDLSTSSWAEEQLFLLHSNGLSLEDVQAAVAHVQKLPHIQLLRTGSASQHQASIIKVLQNVNGCPVLGEPTEGSVERARLLVCGGAQPEAICSMLVMQQILQSKLQVPCYVVRHAAEIGLSKKASRLVVVLTQGLFAEEGFAEIVLSTDMEGWAKVVVNDGSFDFPTPSLSAYRDVQNPELSAAYKSLCGSLALPFTPHLLENDEQVGGDTQHRNRTGDVSADWETLRNTPGTMLKWILAGAPYVSCDSGGFNGESTPLLLVRWLQVAIFMPIMRTHSTIDSTPHFPWLWGARAAVALRQAFNLRYRLLPYHYSLAHAQYASGEPWIRPLLMDFPSDPEARDVSTQWMDGAILVAPILSNRSHYDIHLPKGLWYRLDHVILFMDQGASVLAGRRLGNDDELLTEVVSLAPLQGRTRGSAKWNEVPTFVRPGTVLTLSPVVQHSGDIGKHPLEVVVFGGEDGSFEMVEDDGWSTSYTRGPSASGVYRRTLFTWDDGQKLLSWEMDGKTKAPGARAVGSRRFPRIAGCNRLLPRTDGCPDTAFRRTPFDAPMATSSIRAQRIGVGAALVALAAGALIIQNKGGGHGEIGYHLALKLAREKGLSVTMIQDSACKQDTWLKNDKPPFNCYNDLAAAGVNIKVADLSGGGLAAAMQGVPPCEYVFDNQNICYMDVQAAIQPWSPKVYAYVSSGGMYKPVPTGPLIEGGAVKLDNKQLNNARGLGLNWCAFRPQYIYGPKTNKRDYIDWFLDRITRDLPFPLPADGSLFTTLTNSEDVAGMMASVVGSFADLNW
eukprot:s1669_g3.t1